MAATNRLDLRLKPGDKERIARAAAARGMSVSTFVRSAALRDAGDVMAGEYVRTATSHPHEVADASLATRLRGRATSRLSTDEIMQLTRGT